MRCNSWVPAFALGYAHIHVLIDGYGMISLLPLGEKGQGMRGWRAAARKKSNSPCRHMPARKSLARVLIELRNTLGAPPRGVPSPPAPSPPRGEGRNFLH